MTITENEQSLESGWSNIIENIKYEIVRNVNYQKNHNIIRGSKEFIAIRQRLAEYITMLEFSLPPNMVNEFLKDNNIKWSDLET